MTYPRFTVVTVNFNNREGLQRTIQSVLSQDFTDFEYIVIDGGSTDGSVDIIKEYEDKISYWVSEPDGGAYEGMNKALLSANGEYCIFMNSGDEFYSSQVLSEVAKYGNKFDIGVGISIGIENGIEVNRVYPPQELSLLFLENYSIIHQAAFFRTSLLKKRGYDVTYRIVADWKYIFTEYLTRLYVYMPFPNIICKFDGGGISDNIPQRNVERNKALEELLPPMLLQDANTMKGLRILATDNELFSLFCHVLASRTLTKWLKNIMKVLCKIK